ncbi:glycosyl hydrolase family 18 protein [Sulfoacidibacillus thermotolerans]|uniref:GH18 domain-containing protein n=1 Tax=Sulfoacidibacillus thermotolerans TaxID=1765684 RepID=A0A2U3D7S2_SULT2|nr:glycosyl hydrolase family 18 protein [Sulfoacidibacillus thermotolerans]PWI57309.1 hypothetical protein BM613_09440 [Sulfoacidibacillus thermotolerans]
MRKKMGSVFAAAAITGSVFTIAFAAVYPYSDIANSFARQAIVQLTETGVLHGYANGTFMPNAWVTRGQFLAYLMNALTPYTDVQPASKGIFFSDVPAGNWAYEVVGSAELAGWLNPYWIDLRTGFHENYAASRGDAASFFVAALEHSRLHYTLPAGVSPLAAVTKLGVFSGLPASADPVYLTRADAAVVLENMLAICQQAALHEPLGIVQAVPVAPTAGAVVAGGSPIVLGFNYGESLANDLAEDEQDTAVNTVVYDGFHLDSTLQFTGTLPASFADTLHSYGKKVWGLFGSEQPDLLTAALSSQTQRTALVQSIATTCETAHLDGANIDFENVPGNLRSDLTAFMQQLTSTLHAQGLVTSIDVAVPSAGSWSEAYDYGQLGNTVDDLFLMAYDEHWSGDTTPGPVATQQWVQDNLQTVLQDGVPASRVILGLPLYTRAWQTNDPTQMHSVPLSTMDAMLADGQATQFSFDAAANQWVDRYRDANGVQWEFWQDGVNHLQAMGALAVQDHLAGVGYWQLGDENVTQWPALLPSAGNAQ